MMYGENGEVEYGGDMKYAFKPYNDFEARNKHYFSQFPLDIWKKYDLKEKDLNEFAAPSQADVLKKNIRMYFFGYYKFWDPQVLTTKKILVFK